MKTYPILCTEDGRKIAFEIGNTFISMHRIVRILESIDGVSDVCKRKMFSKFNEVHINFLYQGLDFVVLEPFGDNSRYWIGPKNMDDQNIVGVDSLEAAFTNSPPSILQKLFND